MNVKGTYLYIMFNEYEKKKLQFVSKKIEFSGFLYFWTDWIDLNVLLCFEFQENTIHLFMQKN